MHDWGFYGRSRELDDLKTILARERWFFVRITGRRRIGKTTLIQQALRTVPQREVFYAQIPDSAPAGVLSAFADAMDTFGIAGRFAQPTNLKALAGTIRAMVEAGLVVVLDEFSTSAASTSPSSTRTCKPWSTTGAVALRRSAVGSSCSARCTRTSSRCSRIATPRSSTGPPTPSS